MKANIKSVLLFILLIIFSIAQNLSARSINLDEIYIKKTSRGLKKLAAEKLEVYQKLRGALVDWNVIFAFWVSGDEIVYIKERDSSAINLILKYKIKEHKSVELCRIHGVVTVAKISSGGRYLILKRLIQSIGIIPHGEMIYIDTKSGKINHRKAPYAFLDFSVSQNNNSIILEREKGICEFFLDTGFQNELLPRAEYNDIVTPGNPAIAYPSPDRQKIFVLNGSGGQYRAKIISRAASSLISGISSSSEIWWLDNFSIVYRTGHAGNYSVVLYNLKNNKTSTLLEKSFNTNICYSQHPEILSFLKEQIICLYKRPEDEIVNTGVEGEDISFAADGNRFISLLFKRLFILNINTIEKKRIELKRSWKSILAIYRDLYNKDAFENEYSKLYIGRKINVYRELNDL